MVEPDDTRHVTRVLGRMSAGWKMLLLVALSSVLVIMQHPLLLTSLAAISALLWLSLGPSGQGRRDWTALLWFSLMIVALGLYSAWAQGPGAALATIARLVALVLFALAVMRTTPVTDMMRVVETLLGPAGRLGWVNPAQIALAFGITIRFLPVLKQQWEEIREAQMARGIHVRPHALLVPMLARTLERAGEIAHALESRGAGN